MLSSLRIALRRVWRDPRRTALTVYSTLLSSLRIGWRNVWRNPRRTAITVAAICLNTAVLICCFALIDGMTEQMIHNATQLLVGDAQVHAEGFLSDRNMYKVVEHPERLLALARTEGLQVAPRSFGYGLLSRGTKSAGAQFWGVDPRAELEGFELGRSLESGSFLGPLAKGEIVLGRKLARSLDAAVRPAGVVSGPSSELVAVVQAADGSMGNELFQVVGVLKGAGEGIDRSAAFLHRDDFRRLFESGGRVHEVALNSRGQRPPQEVAGLAREAAPGQDVRTWRELMPALNDMLALNQAGMWIFSLIFFLAAGLGVLNTMLMATYERIREFGVLKALGASPARIVLDVALEAFCLGLVATGLGVALGLSGVLYLSTQGLDMSVFVGEFDLSVSGVAFDPVWRADLRAGAVAIPVVGMWLICVLSSLYPAIKAARLDPVRAIHHR